MRIIRNTAFAVIFIPSVLFLMSFFFAGMAQTINSRLSEPIKAALAFVTAPTAVPIFEILAILTPILLIIFIWRHKLFAISFVFLLLLSSYALFIGIPSLAEGQPSAVSEPTAQDYESALTRLAAELNETSPASDTAPEPRKLLDMARTYAKQELGKSFFAVPTPKPSIISGVLRRAGSLGYFAFPTCELALADNQPPYLFTFTVAHELMHFFGIMREDSASLFAYDFLTSSGSESYRFAACFAAFGHIGRALYEKDSNRYFEIYDTLSETVKEKISERNEYLDGTSAVYSAASGAAITLRDSRGSGSYDATAPLLCNHILKGN